MAPILQTPEDDHSIPSSPSHSSNSTSYYSPISRCCYYNGNCFLPGSSPSQLSPLECVPCILYSPLSYTPSFFISSTNLWDAQSNRGSVKNACEDKLVSLFTPRFVFSLLSDRPPFPIVPHVHLLWSQPPGYPCADGALRRVPCRRPTWSTLSPHLFSPPYQPRI